MLARIGLDISFTKTCFPRIPLSKSLLHAWRYWMVFITDEASGGTGGWVAYSHNSNITCSCYTDINILALILPKN